MIDPGPVGPPKTSRSKFASARPPANLGDSETPASRYNRRVGAFARPFASAVADAIAESTPRGVIDHGAGTGLVTRFLHAQRPTISVYALDPSAALLHGLAGQANCTPLVGVAADLRRVAPDLRVDGVVSSLALMFCPSPADDLEALRAHTATGGRLAVSVLGAAEEVEPFCRYWSAVRSVVTGAWLPAEYPHHRLGDPALLLAVAKEAGWAQASISPVRACRRLGAAFAWEWLSGALPVGVATAYAELDPGVSGRVREEFVAAWGNTRTVTSRGWLLRAVNLG